MITRILLFMFLFSAYGASAQVDTLSLYLIHPKNKSEKLIKQGRRIRIWKTETDIIKGKYTIENDSTLKIGNELYPLADINSIKCSTKEDMFGSAVSGLLPVVLTTLGFIDLANNTEGKGGVYFAAEAGIGIPLMALCGYGAAFGRQRKTEKGWKYEIK